MQCSVSVGRWISQFVCGKAKDREVFSNILFLAVLQILLLSLWTNAWHLTLLLSLLQLCPQKSTWQSLLWQTTFSQCGPLNIKMVACDVARQQADLVLCHKFHTIWPYKSLHISRSRQASSIISIPVSVPEEILSQRLKGFEVTLLSFSSTVKVSQWMFY